MSRTKREIQAAVNAFGALTHELLHHMLNSRHRWQDGIRDVVR